MEVMNPLDYIEYLGHSSVYPPLVDQLSRDKITWRPNVERNLNTTYFVSGEGLVLHFDIDAENNGISKKSEGDYIFDELTMTIMEENKKHGKYVGQIPYGLLQNDSRSQIEAKLGTPTRRAEELDNYYLDGLVWTAAFEGERFQFLKLAVPTNGKRKYGLCP
ncbi:hypothetical protein ABH899_002896 [Paenibacillus sp. RC84]